MLDSVTDWHPLILSLKVSAVATAIALVFGVALGWVFARKSFPGRSVLEAICMLPLVLPPTMMTPEELDALAEGLRTLAKDEANPLARAARSLLVKVATLLPQAGIELD